MLSPPVERLPARVPDAAVQDPRAPEPELRRESQGQPADHRHAVGQVRWLREKEHGSTRERHTHPTLVLGRGGFSVGVKKSYSMEI